MSQNLFLSINSTIAAQFAIQIKTTGSFNMFQTITPPLKTAEGRWKAHKDVVRSPENIPCHPHTYFQSPSTLAVRTRLSQKVPVPLSNIQYIR